MRLQALARGRQARKRSAFSLAATHDWFAGVFGFESGAPSSQALRERNAQLLFPAEEACLERLAQLRSALDAECGEAWTAPDRRAPHVAIDIRPESASLLPPAPAPEVEPPKASYLSRLKKKALYLESRDGAVALLQARARGRRARKQKRRGARSGRKRKSKDAMRILAGMPHRDVDEVFELSYEGALVPIGRLESPKLAVQALGLLEAGSSWSSI